MKLNECQRQLVEKNHNLIYSFARKNKLDLDEWYDVIALALCKAALCFDESKGKFSTFFYFIAGNEVRQVIRKQNAARRIPNDICTSLEYMVVPNEEGIGISVSDTLADHTVNFELGLEIRDSLDTVLDSLSDRGRYIFYGVVNGCTQTEIAKRLGVGQSTVAKHLRTIRNRIEEGLK